MYVYTSMCNSQPHPSLFPWHHLSLQAFALPNPEAAHHLLPGLGLHCVRRQLHADPVAPTAGRTAVEPADLPPEKRWEDGNPLKNCRCIWEKVKVKQLDVG